MNMQHRPTTLRKGQTTTYLKLDDIKQTSILKDISGSLMKFAQKFGLSVAKDATVRFAFSSHKGKRDYQQDEVFAEVTENGATVAILTDGMGGHAAGDVAASIIKKALWSYLSKVMVDTITPEQLGREMRNAVDDANKKIAAHVKKYPKTTGMGATMILAVVLDKKLYWISVGDSLLYLWRSNKCYQVNQDHSMAPAIDQMAKSGIISVEDALQHPDRNVLTSAMTGVEPELVDENNGPVNLIPGDIILLSSDGLQKIYGEKLVKVLKHARSFHPQYVVAALLNSVLDLDDPEQDNVSLLTMKFERDSEDSDDENYEEGAGLLTGEF